MIEFGENMYLVFLNKSFNLFPSITSFNRETTGIRDIKLQAIIMIYLTLELTIRGGS